MCQAIDQFSKANGSVVARRNLVVGVGNEGERVWGGALDDEAVMVSSSHCIPMRSVSSAEEAKP